MQPYDAIVMRVPIQRTAPKCSYADFSLPFPTNCTAKHCPGSSLLPKPPQKNHQPQAGGRCCDAVLHHGEHRGGRTIGGMSTMMGGGEDEHHGTAPAAANTIPSMPSGLLSASAQETRFPLHPLGKQGFLPASPLPRRVTVLIFEALLPLRQSSPAATAQSQSTKRGWKRKDKRALPSRSELRMG